MPAWSESTPEGVLPVHVHPRPPRRLPVRGLVPGRKQQAPHHDRRRDRRPASARRVEVGEVVVADELVTAAGELVVERSLGDQMTKQLTGIKETALRVHASQHPDLRGKLRCCNSPGSGPRSRVFESGDRPIFCCSLT